MVRTIMKFTRRQFLHTAVISAATLQSSRNASAQAYPVRPVRVIVPFAAGGPNDVFARLVVQKIAESLGRPFYVENKAGAGSNIGTGEAARAAPDGYTILVTSDAFAINPLLYAKVPYDPRKDFIPTMLAATFPQLFAVNPAVSAKTLKDLIALIKAAPGKYNFASPGRGTPPHLVGELFRQSVGVDVVHVPYGGAGPALAAVVAGHSHIFTGSPAPATEQVKEGKLVAAVTSRARVTALPDARSIVEAGHPELENESWLGIFVPAHTPEEIVSLLNKEFAKAVALPEIQDRLTKIGLQPATSTPEELSKRIEADTNRWAKVIRASKLTAD